MQPRTMATVALFSSTSQLCGFDFGKPPGFGSQDLGHPHCAGSTKRALTHEEDPQQLTPASRAWCSLQCELWNIARDRLAAAGAHSPSHDSDGDDSH
jgi:hypothetical protein